MLTQINAKRQGRKAKKEREERKKQTKERDRDREKKREVEIEAQNIEFCSPFISFFFFLQTEPWENNIL